MIRKSSIQRKIFGVIFALTATLVAFLATYFPARHLEFVQRATQDKAVMYARLLSREAESAVAFDDRETAREIFDATAQDRDVRALALIGASGRPLHVLGDPSFLDLPRDVHEIRIEASKGLIHVAVPVASKEGPRGVLILELGTEAIEAERVHVRKAALVVGLLALGVGFLSAWVFSRSLAARLGAIAAATKAVASGSLDQPPLSDRSSDEVGQLAGSFNAMTANINALVAQISRAAATEKERLDNLVAERTAQLDARNNDMRLVLDNVGQGFFTVALDGTISQERSAIAERWLGTPPSGATLADWVGAIDATFGPCMQAGWDALADGFMPTELLLEQLPKTLRRGSSTFAFTYSPIVINGELARVLVVISDVTSDRERERSQAEQREFQGIFERIFRDRAGFFEFLEEAEDLVRFVGMPHENLTSELLRAIHTLKGNCSVFGLTSIADACHALEDALGETHAPPTALQREDFLARWVACTARIQMLNGSDGPVKIEAEETEYERLIAGIANGSPRMQLVRDLSSWRFEPTSRRLTRLADQARSTAARLRKGELVVKTEHNGLRLSAGRWTRFWAALTHVIRNAVDHGIERPEERASLGKSENGTLTLRTYTEGTSFVVEVADDGRGIDWDAVAERARALGLPASTAAQLEEVIFRDGVSAKREVTQFSGRGIGLGAVRAECVALGGTVSVSTTQGQGTRFRFVVPQAAQTDADRVSVESLIAPPCAVA